jgi:hypothetical protein
MDDQATFNTVPGQKEYNLPDNILEISLVEYDGIPLTIYNFSEAEKRSAYNTATILPIQGHPEWAYFRALTNSNTVTALGGNPSVVPPSRTIVGFFPIPSDAKQVTVYGSNRPPLLVLDSDTPAFPDEFHEMIYSYMMFRMWKKDMEPEQAAFYRAEFEKDLSKMRIYFTNMKPIYSEYITDTV